MAADELGPDDPMPDEREQRIAHLEKKLARPSGVGVLPPVALIALGFCLYQLYDQRLDLAYSFSDEEPIELGAVGDYRFGELQSNRYVRVQGVPTSTGAYWLERASTFVAVGLQDTPIIVARVLLPSESWKPGDKARRPDPRPFTVKGRLLSRADAVKYEDAFVKHAAFGEIAPKWLLIAEEHPGGDFGTKLWFGLLFAFSMLNAWFLLRGVVAFLRR